MTSEPTLEETALHLMRFALEEANMRREQVKRAEDAAEHWRAIGEREKQKREAALSQPSPKGGE